jgi:hypothetical protein
MSCHDVVCIIGMHRSGTSMIARALKLCGLNLGNDDQLLASNDSNPLGHFEHEEVLRINESLLAHFGGSWHNPPELRQGWEKDASLSYLTAEARQLVGTFSETPLWGWKEPRTTLLVPFWKSIVPGLRFVICVRSPLDVARSLQSRDGLSIGAGASLWHQYSRAAVRNTVGSPRIFTFYEDCFRDPVLEINRVAEFCGLAPCGNPSELGDPIARELRHHASETTDLLNATMIPAQIKLFYLYLQAACSQAYSRRRSCPCASDMTSELEDELLDLQTAIEAGREQELHAIQSEMRRQLTEKSQQLFDLEKQMGELQKQNLGLHEFSDAVRGTLVYRFYRKCLKPLGISVR